jgi:parvulin-like peptidyl-prolyl isomerase
LSRRARAVSPRINNPLVDLDPERRNAVFLIAGIGALILLSLGLIGYGYYTDRIAPKHETVLQVGDRSFDYSYLERRAVAATNEGKLKLDSSESITIGIYEVLARIEREEALRQAAAARGMTISREELENQIKERLKLSPETSRDVLAGNLRVELQRLDLPLAEYEDLVRAEIIDERLRKEFEAAIPAELEHADVRLIQLPTQEKADEAKQRLEKGESPAVVAGTMSIHATKGQAGELGFIARGSLPPKVDDAAFSQIGLSEMIQTPEGFFFVETKSREVREVTGSAKRQVAERSLTTLIETTREEVGADRRLTIRQITQIGRGLLNRLG